MVDVGLGLTSFLPPDDVHLWNKAILDFKNKGNLSDTAILEQFRNKGFDSPAAVKDIEDKYISLKTK